MTNLARALNINKAGAIDGWMSEPELLLLAEFAQTSKLICEAGSYKGRSTRALADNTDGIVYAVDPWDGKYQVYGCRDYGDEAFRAYHQNGNDEVYSQFYINLYDHIKSHKVRVRRMNFTEFAPAAHLKFDFIFLDAIHEYEALSHDILHALSLLAPHSILAGHDYMPAWPGVIKAVDELIPNKEVKESIWFTQI